MWLVGLMLACGGPDATEAPVGPEPAAQAPEPVLRRLTEGEFRASIADVLGPDILISSLEPDHAEGGLLAIGASGEAISPRGVEQYEAAAQSIAEQAMAAPEGLLPCAPSGAVDEGCAAMAIDALGRRLYRRPLDADERAALVGLATEAASTLGDFHEGLAMALGAMLQSPSFLYRVELGEADPAGGGRYRYTDWEMASRLSYFLWHSTPDDALLDAAAAGELTTEAGLAAQVDRMLASPRARAGFRAYIDELLALYELDHLIKDPTIFPQMRADLGESAREETLRAVEALVFDRGADFRGWLTTPDTFVNTTLAMLYAVPAPSLDGFGATTLPSDGQRAGLLGQAAVLAKYAHPVSSSATKRGVFVREVLMCQDIPAPPANVNTSLPEPSPDSATLRDRVAVHLEEPTCAGCHRLTDPIGLGLENFDGLGVFRETEAGARIDPSGDLGGVPFMNARQLGAVISKDPAFSHCMAESVFSYAVGHRPSEGEEDVVDWLDARFAEEGFAMVPLLRQIALSDAFRFTSAVTP